MDFTEASSGAPGPALPLSAAPYGAELQIAFSAPGERAAEPLRDIGFREGAVLLVISSQPRMIVGVGSSRIVIATGAAVGVFGKEILRDDHVERPQAP